MGGVGEGGAATMPECADGYSDWLSSSFAFPDGDVIGTADFPSMPWIPTEGLRIVGGRLAGAGTAVVSQGIAFPYAGLRMRFRARFTDSEQQVSAVFDAAKSGIGGVRVTIDSTGRLALTEGKVVVKTTEFAPLETGVDWFIEAIFKGAGAQISVARANYGTERQAKVEATLSTDSLSVTEAGKVVVAELVSASGVVPSMDELIVARCGASPGDYEPKLVDMFERGNSASLGKPEFPVGAMWSSSSSTIKIVDGALQTSGALEVATIPLQVPLTGLRIRTTLKVVKVATGPSGLWADVNFNVTQTRSGLPAQGFWVWSDDFTSFYTGIFTGGGSLKHERALASSEQHYVQMDRDGDVAVITVREQSFDGPILGAQYAGGLQPNADPGGFFSLGDEGGAGTRFEDVRVDSYLPE